MTTRRQTLKNLLVDGHVHIYPEYNLNRLFDFAYDNLQHHALKSSFGNAIGVLCLTETHSCSYFKHLRNIANTPGQSKDSGGLSWKFCRTQEENSLLTHTAVTKKTLVLIAGRQLVTREKLEVLAYGVERVLPDGLTLAKTLEHVNEAGGMAVIPWAVGKWTGKRLAIVRQTLRANPDSSPFLGDNSGRPWFWIQPALLKNQASEHKLLSGSDPLPLPGEERATGRMGFRLQCVWDAERPANSLLSALRDDEMGAISFGKPEHITRFFLNQMRLRLNKKGKMMRRKVSP